MMKLISKFMFVLCCISLMLGCSDTENSSNKQVELKEDISEPVTLRVYNMVKLTDSEFEMLITDPVKKAYPHITVEPLNMNQQQFYEYALLTHNPVDLVMYWTGVIGIFLERNLLLDMRSLIDKYNFDLDRYQPNMIDPCQGESGEIYCLPYHNNVNLLVYNKEIFHRFGIEYPKDGMFWEDTIELARQITREEDGVKYYGYNFGFVYGYRLYAPLSLGLVDDRIGKAIINNDQWKKVLGLMKAFVDAQGETIIQNGWKDFFQNQNIAMIGEVVDILNRDQVKEAPFDWDIAQFPSWEERPNTFGFADLHAMGILSVTKHPDDAMKVLNTFMSEEVQLKNVSQTVRVSPLKGEKYQEHFAKEIPHLQGKRLDSIFKSQSAPYPESGISIHHVDARGIAQNIFKEALLGRIDINTALLQAEEEINQYIASLDDNDQVTK